MKIEIRKIYYKNRKIQYELSYLDNIRHGIQKEYYPDGQIKYCYHIKKGAFNGLNQEWNYKGTRFIIGKYKENNYVGFKITSKYGS